MARESSHGVYGARFVSVFNGGQSSRRATKCRFVSLERDGVRTSVTYCVTENSREEKRREQGGAGALQVIVKKGERAMWLIGTSRDSAERKES